MRFQPSALREPFTRAVRPLMDALVRTGVHPNTVTTVGFLITVSAGAAFFWGRIQLGGFLVLLGGLCDAIDGYVARASGKASKFGSFYDSTLDRASEVVVFLGVFSLYSGMSPELGRPWMVYVVALAMAGSLMVSYTRARAEGLGIDTNVGLMQRPERVILLGGSAWFFGSWHEGVVLTWVMIGMAVLTNLTAFYRILWVYRHTRVPAMPAAAAHPRDPATRDTRRA